jgi:hypothetical protein
VILASKLPRRRIKQKQIKQNGKHTTKNFECFIFSQNASQRQHQTKDGDGALGHEHFDSVIRMFLQKL